MKKNKGFTLIELLAVIVILGLLMAIAIPSVTKYITESRKKTLTTTLGNYIGALVNEVNDLSYTFTGTNTIYAVPIECIALERGGTNPFGHWYQANDAYFAYVLIQYDDQNSKYVYGFTFKDSAGYGLYPTIQGNINEKGTQVKTGYTINKPVTGDLTSLVTLVKWQESGFKVDSNTNLQVLEATSENEVGNGITTCTLQQKGDNYAQVEEEKNNQNNEDEIVDNLPEVSTPVYFGYRYNLLHYEDGLYEVWGYVFNEDGSAQVYINEELVETVPVGYLSYTSTQIFSDSNPVFTISSDKRKLHVIGESEFALLYNPNVDTVYFGRKYSNYMDGEKYTYIMYEDGSGYLYVDDVLARHFPIGWVQYTNVAFLMEGKVRFIVAENLKSVTVVDEEYTGIRGTWYLEE